MSLPLYFGVLTLAPAVAALLLVGMGLALRPTARAALALTIVGALLPIAGLIYLVTDLTSGSPVQVTLVGSAGPSAWLSLVYRYDGYAVYAAFGVAVIIAPLLLWMVWRGGTAAAADVEPDAEPAEANDETAAEGDAEGEAETPWERRRAGDAGASQLVPRELWAGLALVLGLESAALVLCFADTLIWLALAWIALAALAWGVGELGAEAGDLDRRSLGLMLAGPVLWLVAMLFIAGPVGAARLSDLAGVGGASIWLVLVVCVFLALAGGAYPFNGWVRRRAIVTPPVGFAAVVLAVLPAALFAAGRTYAALQDAANYWPQLGAATPPITIGIALVLLGALTVAICGLLALSFRDGRTLVALLATAQIGWGLLALGIGRPLSALALVVLLATSVLGLGALVAALFAGEMLTSGEEPEGAGPQPFGAPRRPLALLAWTLGATALIGAPLFGGFVVRQLISAAALTAAQLTIPLAGLAWVGDALLALAFVRATAPAWSAKPLSASLSAQGELPEALAGTTPTTVTEPATPEEVTEEEGAEEEGAEPEGALGEAPEDEEDAEEDAEEDEGAVARPSWRERLREVEPAELPGLALALLALVIGIAPGALFLLGGLHAAQALLQPSTLDLVFRLLPLGYDAGTSQWLPSFAWIAIVILAVLAALVREIARPAPRVARPIALAGQAQPEPAAAVTEPVPTEPVPTEPVPAELASLAEPGDAWKELAGAVDSGITVPGVEWLLRDLDEDEDADEDEDGEAVADEAMRALREADGDGGRMTGAPPEAPETEETDTGGNPHPAGTRGEGTGEQP